MLKSIPSTALQFVCTMLVAQSSMLRVFLFVAFLAVWTKFASCGRVKFDHDRFTASWKRQDDTIQFRVEVKTTGWVSFGFALQAPTGMRGYDVMMGGVKNGIGYIGDYYTFGFGTPGTDRNGLGFTLTSSSERNGVTTLEFERPMKTSDDHSDQPDIQLTEGKEVYLVWAYNFNRDNIKRRHTRRGVSQVKYVIAEPSKKPAINLPPKPAPQASHVTQAPPPVPVVHQPNVVSFDGGKFVASWVYDPKSAIIKFKVEVATTGWVSFGMAHTAPNNMWYYDVIIGGVTDNGFKYLYDYNTNGPRVPRLDIFQDYVLNNASETNGKTVLEYERKFRTDDVFYGDVQFHEDEGMALVWAYNSKEDSKSDTDIAKHTNRGTSNNVKYIIAPKPRSVPKGPSHAQYQKQIQAKKQGRRKRRSISDDAKTRANFDGGKYTVSWQVDTSSKKIQFTVEAQTTGWVALGFAKRAPNSMRDYDVVVGGVLDSGQGYLYDYYTNGYNLPPRDTSQDYTLKTSSETNGKTRLTFERKLQTGDQNDVQFTEGNMVHLLWAYDSADSYGPDYFARHSNRGYSGLKYDMAPAVAKQTPPPKVDVKVDPLAKKVSFDGGKFSVTWRYDSSEGKIHFDLEVRTTGWVGFGIAKQAPNQMKDYDVIVGGVLDSGQGYLYDYYTEGFGLPPLDGSQDYKLTSSSQKNGKTFLAFERKLKTDDPKDVQIEAGGKYHLVYAYDNKGDSFGPISFSKHSSAGNSALYELVTQDDPTTTTSTSAIDPTSATVPAGTSATSKHSASFDNGKFQVSWEFDPSEDKVRFRLEVEARGWVGFGFAKNAPNSMKDYDIIVGGALDTGNGYLYDYYSSGFGRPPLDSSQDYKLIRAAETNGKTTLEFERKRDTGDSDDVQFTEGVPMYMVWAYHSQDSYGPLSFSKHDDKGSSDVEYDIAVNEVTSSVVTSSSLLTSSHSMSTADWSSSVSPTKSSSSVFTPSSSASLSSSSNQLSTFSSSSYSLSSSSSELSTFSTVASLSPSSSISSSSSEQSVSSSSSSSSSISSSSSSSSPSSTVSSTDSSSSVLTTDSSSSSSSAHVTSTSSPLSTQSSMSPTESSLQATTSSSPTTPTDPAPAIDTSSARPESSTTITEVKSSSEMAQSSLKEIPSSSTTPRSATKKEMAASAVINLDKRPIPTRIPVVLPTPTPVAAEASPTVALPTSYGAEQSTSLVPFVVIEESSEIPTEGTNEVEKTDSPDEIAFEPDFDLRNRSNPVPCSLMNICLAALVYSLHCLILL